MADDDEMMSVLINQKENVPPTSPVKITTDISVKMILNEKTGNMEIIKCETDKWEINNPVLVRYSIKIKRIFFIGIIEKVINKKYKTNYFKTMRQNGNLKFTKPKVCRH